MEFHFPQHVHAGQGTGQRIGLMARHAGSRLLLIVDSAFDGSQELGILTASLERASVSYLVLSRAQYESSGAALKEILAVAKASRSDLLAALGGSDILSLVRQAHGELSQSGPLTYFEVPTGFCDPLLLRPEAFVNSGHPSSIRFVPYAPSAQHHVFLDPHLQLPLTPKAAVSGLLEAVFYGFECLCYDGIGLVEQSLLLGAIESLWTSLQGIYENPSLLELRLRAAEAGLSISAACALMPRGTGMSFVATLAGLTGLPTSTLATLMLPALFEASNEGFAENLSRLAPRMGLPSNAASDTLGLRLAQEVRRFLASHQIPLRLSQYQLVDTQITQAVDVVLGLDLRRRGLLNQESLAGFVRSVL